jgi:hypothetical protein
MACLVKNLPKQNSISNFVIEVSTICFERQEVFELNHVTQVGVDPVGKGSLLLSQYHVITVPMFTCQIIEELLNLPTSTVVG